MSKAILSAGTLPPFPEIYGIEFRFIKVFIGIAASDDGRIWSCIEPPGRWNRYRDWREFKYARNKKGHLWVSLKGKKHYVHRIILETFVGPCPDGMECCHKNDIPSDNMVSNLRWDTHSENMRDRTRRGEGLGIARVYSKLTEESVVEIRRLAQIGISQWEIADRFGVHQSTIQNAVHGITWGHVPHM